MKKMLALSAMSGAAVGMPLLTAGIPKLVGILTALLGGGVVAQFFFGTAGFFTDMFYGGGPIRCLFTAL